jgi:hypothetical protein
LKVKGQPFLHFDLGDFTKIDDVTGDYETRFIWEMFEKMDVAAVAPGPRELTAWNTFKDLVAKGTVPVIASNISLKEGGKSVPFGLPYKIYTVNGLRVAAFSLLGGSEFSTVRAPEGVEFDFQDPFQVAGVLVPELRKQADLVVLLSEMAPSDTDRMIEAVPGIDVALYGQRASWEEKAQKRGETIVNQTGTRGQYAGKLVLIVDPNGKIVEFGSQNAALDNVFPADQGITKLVDAANEESKQLRTATREKREGESQSKLTGERFLGSETCKRCHEKEYQQWMESPHAKAFTTLNKPVQGKPRTGVCVSCHVTGFGQSGGFIADPAQIDQRPKSNPDLTNVQCEACHGKGTEHARTTGHAVVPETTCRVCHNAEWSPAFDYSKALLAVKHS